MTPASQAPARHPCLSLVARGAFQLASNVRSSIAAADIVLVERGFDLGGCDHRSPWAASISPTRLKRVSHASGFEKLVITFSHAEERAGRLPPTHRDPFDRMRPPRRLPGQR